MSSTTPPPSSPFSDPTKKCTCGPKPIVDMTKYDTSNPIPDSIKRHVRNAAASHGCFHLLLPPAQAQLLPLIETSHTIRKLFNNDDDDNNNNIFHNEGVDNSTFTTVFTGDHDGDGGKIRMAATYRGRTSESGDGTCEKDAVLRGEPKQSWEFRRCQCCSNKNGENFEKVTRSSTKLQTLHHWTTILHSFSLLVSQSLNLPPPFLHQSPCRHNNLSSSTLHHPCCNADLLRVFFYDSLPTQLQQLHPGSSPHTDWGSLTIVWQDDTGGLETFCRCHEIWDGVAYVPGSVFCHVGDFTSLASKGRWASPRHRVVCGERVRGSLVYFGYPSIGMSLKKGMEALSRVDDGGEEEIVYSDYSLLVNQSLEEGGEEEDACRRVYKRIEGVPFDLVIKEKWDQVQRT